MIKNAQLLIFFLIILVACHSKKTLTRGDASSDSSPKLTFTEAFLQEEISGQKEETSKHYLTLKLEATDLSNEIEIDSIKFETNSYPLTSAFGKTHLKETIQLRLEETKLTGMKEALVFFSKREQVFKQTVPLSVKPTLYLP